MRARWAEVPTHLFLPLGLVETRQYELQSRAFPLFADLDFSGLASIPVKIYPPKPEHCLHFCLTGVIHIRYEGETAQTFSKPVLVGQQTRPFERATESRILNFQIVFQPGAIKQLLDIPATELTNKHVDAVSAFGPDVDLLRRKLEDASSYAAMLASAESLVHAIKMKMHKRSRSLEPAIKMLKSGLNRIDNVASELCLSTKQFKRVFIDAVGVNPKTFQRIIRFNKAYNFRNRFPSTDWLTIALHCGYYDYTHLVKDYKDLTGMTPNEFHALEQSSPEGILGLALDLYRSRFDGNDQLLFSR
jgi:AraC-like DNA-binding protein